MDALALTRLLQLASPALPVGAYSYSQGLESAIEDGIVTEEGSATAWIADVMHFSIGSFEAPLLWRMSQAMEENDMAQFENWNAVFRAGRETMELRAETLQMGQSLVTLMRELPLFATTDTDMLKAMGGITFPAAFSFAAHHMGVERFASLVAYLWSWLENQMMAALKAIPLGQSAGQRMLLVIGGAIPEIAQRATELEEGELSNFAPGLAICSSRHEIQYSRIFRS